MKTVDEWCQHYATSSMNYDIYELIRSVREEAFERAELEAYRAGRDMGINAIGEKFARRIAKVRIEEGSK